MIVSQEMAYGAIRMCFTVFVMVRKNLHGA